MGLDMYLRAKTTKRKYEGATGACSGFFGVAPEDHNLVEIGYWRKAFDQRDVILDNISRGASDIDNHMLITREGCESILNTAKNILSTHKFNEDGVDITGDDEAYGIWCETWMSESKWEDTIEFFTEAIKILDEDTDAKIYYCEWY